MKKQIGTTLVELVVVLVVLAGSIGWIWNIVKIIGSDFAFSGMLIARVIGVFVAPVGAVLGYF